MMKFPAFPRKMREKAKKWAKDDKKQYIMYIVKHDNEKTFVTGATKTELTKFRKQQGQDYKGTKIVKVSLRKKGK